MYSIGKSSSFFKAYAKSGYLDRMNPQQFGISKKFYNQKKQLSKVENVRKKLDKQIAYMQRVQRKMQTQLKRKNQQLMYTKDVTKRFHNDLNNKQSFKKYKSEVIRQNQSKAEFMKSQSSKKIQQAKQYILQHKRSLAQINKTENKKIQELKSMKKAQQWDDNRSRVSEITKFQKNLKNSCNKFYKQKNESTMKLYESRILSFRKRKDEDLQQIQTLQQKLISLKNKYTSQNNKKQELNKQILRIKQQSRLESSRIRETMRSKSSESVSRSQIAGKDVQRDHKQQNSQI